MEEQKVEVKSDAQIVADKVAEAFVPQPSLSNMDQNVVDAPVSISGVMGEKVNPIGPTASPATQIAPVSANGEQTSAREAPKQDVDAATNPQVSSPQQAIEKPVAQSPTSSPQPSVAQASPTPTEVKEQPAQEEVVDEPVEEDPIEQANSFIQQIPGRFRLY